MNKTARFVGHLKPLNVFTSIASSRRNKLLCAFLVMTGLTIVLSVLTWSNQAKAQAKIDDIAAVDFRLGRLGLEIGNTIQTAQGYQKDYLLQYQQLGVEKARAVYLKNFQTAVARIHQKTGEIKHVAIDPQDLEAVDTIDRAIDAYQTAFESVVTWLQNRAGFAALLPAQVDSIDRGIQAVGSPALQILMLKIRQHEKDFFLRGDITSANRLHTLVEQCKEAIALARLNKDQTAALMAKLATYRGAFDQVVQADQAVQERQKTLESQVTTIQSLLAHMERKSVGREARTRQELMAIGREMRWIESVGAVAIILASGLLAFVLSNRLTRPFRHLRDVCDRIRDGDYSVRAEVLCRDELGTVTASLNILLDQVLALIPLQEERDAMQASIMKLLAEVSEVAEGDLTVQAEVTEDMTGAIADSFNYMIHELRRIVTNVQAATLLVSSSAKEIQATTEHLVEGSAAQATQIIDSSAALDEMAVSIQQVSENATLSAHVAQQALSSANHGARAVRNTIKAMRDMQGQVQETATRIKSLGEHSAEIGKIVKLIGDIADRTSVLALNASIEAALAGEEGQGFAVVAHEVERLADRSLNATQQIRGLVNNIQAETNAVVLAMEESTHEVGQSSQLADQAGQALGEIESVSTRLADLIQSISLAAQQQADGSENLSQSMSEISDVTQQTASGAKQAAVAINKLAVLADELRRSVSTFILPDANRK